LDKLKPTNLGHTVISPYEQALICSTTSSFDEVHFKHKQPQNVSPDLHGTIGAVQEIQDAGDVH